MQCRDSIGLQPNLCMPRCSLAPVRRLRSTSEPCAAPGWPLQGLGLVFKELAFDSTLGYPGEGPEGRTIFDFFRSHQTASTEPHGATEPTNAASNSTAEKLLPIDPDGLWQCDLLVAYCEEVLCNPKVYGKGIYESVDTKRGRCVRCSHPQP